MFQGQCYIATTRPQLQCYSHLFRSRLFAFSLKKRTRRQCSRWLEGKDTNSGPVRRFVALPPTQNDKQTGLTWTIGTTSVWLVDLHSGKAGRETRSSFIPLCTPRDAGREKSSAHAMSAFSNQPRSSCLKVPQITISPLPSTYISPAVRLPHRGLSILSNPYWILRQHWEQGVAPNISSPHLTKSCTPSLVLVLPPRISPLLVSQGPVSTRGLEDALGPIWPMTYFIGKEEM